MKTVRTRDGKLRGSIDSRATLVKGSAVIFILSLAKKVRSKKSATFK